MSHYFSSLPLVRSTERNPLLAELNEIGWNWVNRYGRKLTCRNEEPGVYETPGGTILFTAAARELESLTLDCETIQVKVILTLKYGELVYAGRWFDPLRESMDAFMKEISKSTFGSVTLKLYKGSVSVTGRTSPTVCTGKISRVIREW